MAVKANKTEFVKLKTFKGKIFLKLKDQQLLIQFKRLLPNLTETSLMFLRKFDQ